MTLASLGPSIVTLSGATEKKEWYFVTKIVLTYCEKKLSSDRINRLKFEAEDSLEQFIQPVKYQNNFWYQNVFLTCS